MFNTTLKKIFIFATLGIVAMGIVSADLQATESARMRLQVNGEWGDFDVTAEKITYNDDGTVTFSPPWEISNDDLYMGSKTKPGTFKRGINAKISYVGKNELQLSNTESFNLSVLDLNGKSIYSVSDVTNVTMDSKIMPIQNGSFFMRLEDKNGLFKFVNFMVVNGSFVISPNK